MRSINIRRSNLPHFYALFSRMGHRQARDESQALFFRLQPTAQKCTGGTCAIELFGKVDQFRPFNLPKYFFQYCRNGLDLAEIDRQIIGKPSVASHQNLWLGCCGIPPDTDAVAVRFKRDYLRVWDPHAFVRSGKIDVFVS